jgi:hypothetical protein
MDNLAAITIPLTPEQSAEITQIIESGDQPVRTVFASLGRNDDDPLLFDLRVILEF